MKTTYSKIVLGALILATVFSCKKEAAEAAYANADSTVVSEPSKAVSDSISMTATQQVEGKKFIKKAGVVMEVKDVYNTTIAIEKQLKEMGGFVTSSRINSNVISEETFPLNDDDAKLVRKFRQENEMEVRVPTLKLGEFLEFVNHSNLFLHNRTITAEDVSANIMMAKLEEKRMQKTEKNIEKIKNDKDKVALADGNLQEQNNQKLDNYNLEDDLKYSTVSLSLQEPSERISTIAIANTKNFDNQYRYNFFYDVKNAIVKGFYLVQEIIVGLFTIWPLLIFGALFFYFMRKRNLFAKPKSENTNPKT